MIISLVLFWSLYAIILATLLATITLSILADSIAFTANSLLVAVLCYLSWNVSNYVWKKSAKYLPRERICPKKKAVFITGCDTGFGHQLAKLCDIFGFKVYAGCLLPDQEGAQQLKKSTSNRLTIIKLDVTKDEDVAAARLAVDKTIGEHKLWAVINNAGIMASTEIEMGSMKWFTSQMDVNCIGTIRVTKAFLPLLRHLKGRVINVASLAGRFSIPGMVGYCVSKAGVISFSDGLRREMKKWDIDVITIEPHLFNTNLCNNETNHAMVKKAWDETPNEIKDAYGVNYFDGYKGFLNNILGSARPGIERVPETLFAAITDEFVGPSYKVMGDLETLRIWMWGFWPTRALDYLSYWAGILQTGQPAERIKAIYEKKKVH